MPDDTPTQSELQLEIEGLKARLGEAEETLRAIHSGETDAIVVSGPEGNRVFTLQSADQSYRTLIETMNEGTVTLLPGGTVAYSNRRFAEMVRTPLEQILGSSFVRFLPPPEASLFNSLLEGTGRDGSKAEHTLIARDGTRVPAQLSARPLGGEANAGFCIVVTDLTQEKEVERARNELLLRKSAEEAARQSEERLRSLIETTRDWVWETNARGVYTYTSPKVRDVLGYEPEEVLGKTPFDFMPADEATRIGEEFAAVARDRQAFRNREDVKLHKDGQQVICETNGLAIFDAQHNLAGFRGMTRDITARKRAEEALRHSEQKYRSLLTNIPDVVWTANSTFNFVFLSDSIERVSGFTIEEVYRAGTRLFLSCIHPDDIDRVKAAFEALFTSGAAYDVECRIRCKDGRWIWIHDRALGTYEKDGVRYADGLLSDITARKRADEARAFLASIVESSEDAIIAHTQDGKIASWNRGAELLCGYPAEEVMGKPVSMLIAPERMAEWRQNIASIQRGEPVSHVEGVAVRKDGTRVEVSVSISPIMDGAGRVTASAAIVRDITQRKRAEEALRASELRFRVIFENAAEGILVANSETGKFLFANPAMCKMVGYRADELAHLSVSDLHPPEDLANVIAQFAAPIQDKRQFVPNVRLKHKDGSTSFVEIVGSSLQLDGQECKVGFFTDVTERRRAEDALRTSEEQFRQLAENIREVFFVSTPEPVRVTYLSPAYEEIWSRPRQEVYDRAAAWTETIHPEDRERAISVFARAQQGVATDMEYRIVRPDGSVRWIKNRTFPVSDTQGKFHRVVGTAEDVTERRLVDERVQRLAYYDGLTRLPNRTLLNDRLEKALAGARRRQDKLALLFLDLDGFKLINDSLGHSVGDLLLQEVAERLRKWSRAQDTVARIGGDEFLIALTTIKDTPDAAVAAERIMDAMTPEFVIKDRSFTVTCSIGISIYPDHGADAETLIKNADAAMYSAKEDGRHAFRFFTADMNQQALERLTLEHGLRAALDRNELFLLYQPQLALGALKITGFEALLRWRHPHLGLVGPDKFIHVAENTGLIIPIGEWVLRTACATAREWQRHGLPAVPVAVNVSAVQFRQQGFLGLIREVLRETALSPKYLELELTESLLMSNADETLHVLRELKATGVGLAIDDFGTGYSSFSYLRQFHVSKLKIDRSFVQNMALNPDDAAITAAIISLAKSLNLKVIAEGVENEVQMSFLRDHGCDEIQGYYFSKPLMAEEAAQKLRQRIQAFAARSKV